MNLLVLLEEHYVALLFIIYLLVGLSFAYRSVVEKWYFIKHESNRSALNAIMIVANILVIGACFWAPMFLMGMVNSREKKDDRADKG